MPQLPPLCGWGEGPSRTRGWSAPPARATSCTSHPTPEDTSGRQCLRKQLAGGSHEFSWPSPDGRAPQRTLMKPHTPHLAPSTSTTVVHPPAGNGRLKPVSVVPPAGSPPGTGHRTRLSAGQRRCRGTGKAPACSHRWGPRRASRPCRGPTAHVPAHQHPEQFSTALLLQSCTQQLRTSSATSQHSDRTTKMQ